MVPITMQTFKTHFEIHRFKSFCSSAISSYTLIKVKPASKWNTLEINASINKHFEECAGAFFNL